MSDMLERAARALFVGGVEHISDHDGWIDLPDLFRNSLVTKARAVLMAVRVPCSDVVESGMIAGQFSGMADVAFTAMIDAILAEGE